jgi:hypothetical protein
MQPQIQQLRDLRFPGHNGAGELFPPQIYARNKLLTGHDITAEKTADALFYNCVWKYYCFYIDITRIFEPF